MFTRLEDRHLPKDIYGELADALRLCGRPRLCFKDVLKDVLKRDLAAFGIPVATWETGALDRSSWRSAIHSGRSI